LINIIKSGVGNIGSIVRVIQDLEIQFKIINHPEEINEKWKIILPGVGSFDSFIESLIKQKLYNKLRELVLSKNLPILGICVGMQALFLSSEEGKNTGLSILEGKCIKYKESNIKIPHMGWNKVKIIKNNPLIQDNENYFYFANSYHVLPKNNEIIIATTDHGYNFPSVIGYKNIYGSQFHPEKSYSQGLSLIKNFILKC
tara:strand:+ start:90 stop:689 length:600 start_codon:yes stop_codon:yes gene_type:complete